MRWCGAMASHSHTLCARICVTSTKKSYARDLLIVAERRNQDGRWRAYAASQQLLTACVSRWGSTRRLSTHLGDHAAHGLDDVLIAGAAAEIGREKIEDVVIREVRIRFQRVHRQHQKTRRAESTLKRVVLDECALHGMQLVPLGKAFDRADALALGLDREHQAGSDRLIVKDHGTCAAHPVLAPYMRPGQSALVTDDVDQRSSRLDPNGVVMAVDIELDLELVAHHTNSPDRPPTP